MAQLRMMSLTALALALALGGGLLSATTRAQQNYAVPPAYDAPPTRYEGPPAYDVPPRARKLPSSGDIQLYSQPEETAEPSATPSPRPYPPPAAPRPAWGNDTPDESGPDWSPPGDSLRIQAAQGIRYVSGGVGESERAELEALSGQFNLRLLFAMQGSGNYLADVGVRVLDPSGAVVLSAESKGPWFLAQLPPDVYTVEASVLGQSQRQTARVGQSQSRLNFYWR
ncbi:MAG: carboxypeptidase regulatory-like domain-containing protein [Candidatus Contendobacter sp.]|nr:MAG: carboxypeptidase regulatory-like domain-containing protein [Candidatus Contendobacter sp.]